MVSTLGLHIHVYIYTILITSVYYMQIVGINITPNIQLRIVTFCHIPTVKYIV